MSIKGITLQSTSTYIHFSNLTHEWKAGIEIWFGSSDAKQFGQL